MDQLDITSNRQMSELNMALQAISSQVENLNNTSTSNSPYCEDCGNLIPEKRLKAVPGTTRCVSCQEAFENKE